MVLSCQHPIEVTHRFKGKDQKVQVPCGCCDICRSSHRSVLAQRVSYEQATHLFEIFVTLTYRMEHVPILRRDLENPSMLVLENPRSSNHGKIVSNSFPVCPEADYALCRKQFKQYYTPDKVGSFKVLDWSDLRRFLQHVRIDCYRATGATLRYFAVGEYGPNSFHPHYHILFWADSVSASDWLLKFLHSTTELDDTFDYFERHTDSRSNLNNIFYSPTEPFWPYGTIQATLTDKKHSTISYLSSYLNSVVGNRPAVLDLTFTRESTRHSNYLGSLFFRTYYQCDVFSNIIKDYDTVYGPVKLGGDFLFHGKVRPIPLFLFHDSFPKIPYLSMLPKHSIYFIYSLYPLLSSFSGKDFRVCDFLNLIHKFFSNDRASIPREYVDVLLRFFAIYDLPWSPLHPRHELYKNSFPLDDSNIYLSQIKSAFFASRRFFRLCRLSFFCKWSSAYHIFIDRLCNFYSYLKPQWLLSLFYTSQQEFFDEFGYKPGFNYNTFYAPADPDVAFDSFLIDTQKAFIFEKIKHKKQNDNNLVFVDLYN
ncbi:replication initiator protein [Dipodfec virus RodF1_13]|uniref:Replication initiator protein n=1 Tax=Dipodfec virus RodF1_13 TaxID=2929291 RepID=A0A976N2U6_9VIRU|nr:replication initiator protein [Dipodfec virus RodF1_13]